MPWEGLQALGALEWKAEEASVENLAVVPVAKVVAGAEATELMEAMLRIRHGSLSPSWAAGSRV